MYTIRKQFTFSASHQLKGLRPDHPCGRLHGHNYIVELVLSGDLGENGFVFDYRDLEDFKEWIDEFVDHRHLNEVFPLYPTTAEHLAHTFFRVCVDNFRFPMKMVRVSETPKTWAEFEPDEL